MRTKVLIAGAAGRDFHNFNVVYRDRDEYDVVAFTATQIPDIAGRVYPPLLAGELYPDGIPIRPEAELADLIREHEIDEVVFAYSDVTHEHVMHVASKALAAGAGFRLLSPHDTALTSSKPVVAICAVRTGSGQEPDHAPGRAAAARRRQARGRPAPPDALRRPDEAGRPALRELRGPQRGRAARSRSARSTSRTSPRGTSSSPGSTTRRSSRRPSRRPT